MLHFQTGQNDDRRKHKSEREKCFQRKLPYEAESLDGYEGFCKHY